MWRGDKDHSRITQCRFLDSKQHYKSSLLILTHSLTNLRYPQDGTSTNNMRRIYICIGPSDLGVHVIGDRIRISTYSTNCIINVWMYAIIRERLNANRATHWIFKLWNAEWSHEESQKILDEEGITKPVLGQHTLLSRRVRKICEVSNL